MLFMMYGSMVFSIVLANLERSEMYKIPRLLFLLASVVGMMLTSFHIYGMVFLHVVM